MKRLWVSILLRNSRNWNASPVIVSWYATFSKAPCCRRPLPGSLDGRKALGLTPASFE